MESKKSNEVKHHSCVYQWLK